MRHFNSKYINAGALSDQDAYHIYNGLDALLTHEVNSCLTREMATTPYANGVYAHERGLLGPVMTMMRRGVLVDGAARDHAVTGPGGLNERITKVQATLDEFTGVVWGKPLNVNSYPQLKRFFFDELAIPPIVSHKKGETKISIDRDALEKISKDYVRGRPFANLILRLRDLMKQRDTLTKGLDADGRWRCSFNIGGTETGRFSSSASPFRTGSNLQNIDPALRYIFVPDPGYRLCYLDLQGAEARAVAYLSGDEEYINAVESSDCHTLVAAMVFGIANERSSAEQLFYRGFSYRDMSKRGQHGSNYYGTPRTMASHLKVETKLMEDFQRAYFKRFPGIRLWHEAVARQLQSEGWIETPFGRRRYFWNRLRDDTTLRAAIAFVPQSLIADCLNAGLYKVWYNLEPRLQLLAQCHDALVFQVPDNNEGIELIKQAKDLMTVCQDVTDIHGVTRNMVIPVDVEWGSNWSKKSANNPNGLVKFKI